MFLRFLSTIKHTLVSLIKEEKTYYARLGVWQKRGAKGVATVLSLIGVFLLADICFPLPPKKAFSQQIKAEDGTLLGAYLSPDDKWRLRVRLSEVSPDMIRAIIAKEDKWFYYHWGVNPFAVGRAIFQNTHQAKRISGASTITMQLARLSYPQPRSYQAKLSEMFRSLQLEWHYSKKEILELYLSYLPYGGNIEGIHSASYLFFHRAPDKLSLSQSILLAIIPNRPNSLRLDRDVTEVIRFRDTWIQRFRKAGTFPNNQLDAAKSEAVSSQRFPIEMKAPQLCQFFHEKYPQTEIYSTIRPHIQHPVQQLLKNHVQRVKNFNVTNGAILVVDNHTHTVVGYCGSADFEDVGAKGKVNGIRAMRSPGSALKPLIYGLGFEQGIITPKMKLPDIPSNFSGYAPDNFDMQFRGMVTVHTALAHSLNLPPIWLLKEVGYESFLNTLEKAGFTDIEKRREKLGYSVALGGCGVTLEEMVRCYSSFANEGKMYPLSYTKEEAAAEKKPTVLFSEATTYILGTILSDLERPDLPQSYIHDSKMPKIAWKTGTSYGKRDAWAIGYSPDFTVGVWMGNMSGKGAPELSGAVMAVPLLLDVFTAINYNAKQKWFRQPANVLTREVCAESGQIPISICKHRTTDFYIHHISSQEACNLYQKIPISEDGAFQYCPICQPLNGYILKTYPIYPPEVALWQRNNQVGIDVPPPHYPKCAGILGGEGPKILSPTSDSEYFLEENNPQQLLLQAAADAGVSQLHWYINGQFLKTSPAQEKVFITPPAGNLHVACVDDKGRKSEVTVKIVRY